MKEIKRIFIVCSCIVFVACNQQKVEDIGAQNTQIEKEMAAKDSVLNEMLGAFNEIQANLEAIKEQEGILRVRSSNQTESTEDLKKSIDADVQLIADLMKKNKALISNLNSRLKASQSNLGELKKLVSNLNDQLAAKDLEIERLNQLLENSKLELGQLYWVLDSLSFSNLMKDQQLEDQEGQMNTAYFAYGTFKELKEKSVLTKEGGFLGLGRNQELKDNFNKEYFSKIDIRKQRSFLIYASKAELITNHPSGSYKLMGEEGVDSLVITNPQEFWRASNYLVIVVD